MHFKHLSKVFAEIIGDGVNQVPECFPDSDLTLGSNLSVCTDVKGLAELRTLSGMNYCIV